MADTNINMNVRTRGAAKAQKSFQDIGSTILRVSASLGTAALAAKGLFDVIERAGKIQGVTQAFRRVNISLRDLREATQGTVSDFELMQKAVQAKNLGVPIENLATLMKFASIRARETGENIDYLVNSIVNGIGRKSVLILDNLGLSAVEVNKEFKKMGDFGAAVGKIVQEQLTQMDSELGKVAQETSRVGAAFSNLYDEVARVIGSAEEEGGILSFFADALEGLTKYINFWYGDGSKVFGEQAKANAEIAATGKDAGKAIEELEEKTYKFAETMARLNIVGMPEEKPIDRKKIPIVRALDEAQKIAGPAFKEIEGKTEGLVLYWDTAANQMVSTFDYVFTETLIREQAFADAMVAGFRSMLERMTAELLARSFVFGVLSLFGAGGSESFINYVAQPVLGLTSAGGSPQAQTNVNVTGNVVDQVVMKRDLAPMLKKISQGIAV